MSTMIEVHEESTSEFDEDLPFALSVHPALQPNASQVSGGRLGESSAAASSSSLKSPPGLTSSLLSSPTDGESQASAASAGDHDDEAAGASSLGYGRASFFPSSQYLDAAASMLHPASSVLNLSLVRNSHPTAGSAATLLPPTERSSLPNPERSRDFQPAAQETPGVSFSALLRAADDRHREASRRQGTSHRQLRGLEEEQELSLASTSMLSGSTVSRPIYESAEMVRDSIVRSPERQSPAFEAAPAPSNAWSTSDSAAAAPASGEDSADAWYASHQHHGSQTIVPAAYSVSSPAAAPSRSGGRMFSAGDERRLAALAGATATRTGENSFRVSLDLSPSCTSVREVMDVVGNPDLLLLWCDPLTGLIVTRSSEGTRNRSASPQSSPSPSPSPSVSGSSGTAPEREYDGEWIEATSPPLMAPPSTSCVYSTGRALSSALGFPTFGKLVMFVERSRGQVSLTMAPFPGGIEVLYKIRVEAIAGGRVRIVNDVALRRASSEDSYDSLSFCGLWDLVEKCLLPTMDNYMDQVLSSTARLRFLVENKEVTMLGDNLASPSRYREQHGVSTAPLLAGV